MQYDLNLLRTFVALMEERNVTRAAQKLGMTQPALSNALLRLRTTLRDPLFVRERYGMRPTARAEALAPVVSLALASLDDVVRGQREFVPSEATDSFVIALNGYVEFALAPRIVARLRATAPNVKIRIVPFGTDLAETGVTSGATSLVLGRITQPPDNLVVQHLMDERLACLVRADHPLVGKRLTKAQYESLEHVNVLPPGRLRVGLSQTLERHGLRRNVAVSMTSFLVVPEMIAVTDYCATLPLAICQRVASDPRFKIVAPPVDLGSFPVEMAWHVRHRTDPAHAWLRASISAVAAEVAPRPIASKKRAKSARR